MEELLLCLDLWKVTVCLDLFGDFFFWLGNGKSEVGHLAGINS